jgi:hypothetical protein
VSFSATKLAGATQALVMGMVDDPLIPSSFDQAFVRFTLDPGGGYTESVVAKEGDVLPGQTQPIVTFQTSPLTFALNESGSVIYTVDLDGPGTVDTAVYRDGTLIAQEGFPSPIGTNWSPLTNNVRTAINAGSYAMLGRVGTADPATDQLLIRNGAVFIQKGDPAPGIGGGLVVTSFGGGAIALTADGRLLWYAEWSDPDPSANAGLYLEHEVVVRKGDMTGAGAAIESIVGAQYSYAISPDGRFLAFKAVLADGREGAFLADLSACPADVDGSGAVGFDDLLAVLAAWGPCPACAADVDHDGGVGFADLLAVLSAWGACP